MTTFLLAFLVVLLVFLAMGIGVLCGRGPLTRGCAHLGGFEDTCAGCRQGRQRDGDGR
ncbi:MAG: hypothetical protein ACYTG6_08350 [Planctomycetota bacterium]|jgi:hypothetical protein